MNQNLTEESPLTARERKLTDQIEELNRRIYEMHEANAALHDRLDEADKQIETMKAQPDVSVDKLKIHMMDVLYGLNEEGVDFADIGASASAYSNLLRHLYLIGKEER